MYQGKRGATEENKDLLVQSRNLIAEQYLRSIFFKAKF